MRGRPGPILVDVSSLVVARRRATGGGSAASRRLAWRDRMRRGSWTATDLTYIIALFFIVGLNLLDITITLIHTSVHGWGVEANPLIRSIALSAGAASAVAFKLALVAVALGIMWYLYRRTAHAAVVARDTAEARRAVSVQRVVAAGTVTLMLFYAWVVLHNVRVAFA